LAAAPVGEAVGESVSEAVVATVPGPWSPDEGADASGVATAEDTEVRTVTAEPVDPPGSPTVTLVDTDAPTVPEPPSDEAADADTSDEDAVPAETGEDDEGDDEQSEPAVWDDLADCESGDWDRDGDPIPGTARWDYGLEFAHEGFELFEGGLNFHPDTWDEFRDPQMPDHAGHADREQEIVVGERVLEAQGWGAWPVCSEMLGLR
jgi:resuscitation-promoting factor RpfB